ncbi:MAG: ribulose 1,5-bisphosphate carboxylase [Acidobacteria bacterium]|nr:ribulose 1,5-bisphosphate carboxylase [Acidobacteriota bacterium]
MYKRFYDPDVFMHNLDSVDRKHNIIATYSLDDEIPGWDFIDHFALIKEIIIEGSTGSWERVAEETPEVRQRLSGKLVGYYEIPVENPSRRVAVVQIAFPIDAWIDNVTMMLLTIAGNIWALAPKTRLLDIAIPDDLLANFKGPKFGVPGIRELTGVKERPLILHIIKPKMGMTPKETANQCYQTALGGVDMMKDDEMCSDLYNSKFDDRLKAVMDALEKAKAKTGRKPIYLLSITDEPRRIFDKAARAVELGCNGLLVTYSAGLGAFRQLAEDPAINVPIMLHPSHMLGYRPTISWPVFAKMARLCGADLMLTPTLWGAVPVVPLEEVLRTVATKQAPLGHIKPMWPMPSGGTHPGVCPIYVGECGPDIIIPSGGGMLAHPDGYTAGAKAWRQAIDATMSGEPLVDCAKKPENKELRRALEKWGTFERPSTPWLRLSPKYHPKPMKFD